MGQCKLEGSIVPHPVHSHTTIQILELQVWNILICLVMHRIICLLNEILDMVSPKGYPFPYHQRGYHIYHRRSLGGRG